MNFIISLYRSAFSNLQRNIWILATGMFINRSGSMVLTFASLYFTKELHFSIGEAGIIMSCFGAGGVVGSYLGGWLTDRRHYFSIMVFSLIGSGLILLLMLIATSPIAIGLILFCNATVADMYRPANAAAMAIYTTPDNRTRSVSLIRLAANLGWSVGPAAGGFIAFYIGYDWLFLIDSLTSFGAALMLYFYLPRDTSGKKSESTRIKPAISTSAYRDVVYILFIVLVALYGISFFQITATIPQYFNRVCHYHEDTIGLLLALNGFIVVIAEMPLITILQRNERIFTFIVAGTLCIPLAFAVLLLGEGILFWSVIYIMIITASEMLAMPFMMNFTLSRPMKERQGQYAALYSMAFGISIMSAPVIGLTIAGQYGFQVAFYFFIALSLLAALGFGILRRKSGQHHF